MNVAAEISWSLLRAITVAGFALGLATPMARALAGWRGWKRIAMWALLLAPSILIGYAGTRGVLVGGARSMWSEAFYAAVLIARQTPIAVVLLSSVASPIAAEALHCFRLLAPHSRWLDWRFRWHAHGYGPAVAFTLVFLLVFTEFEIAMLCNVRTWTVALFDAHAGGLPLGDSLRLTAGPARHYGETAVLAAMACTAFGTPIAVLLLTGFIARFYPPSHGR